MNLIVQKFGGTSVANAERIEHVADIMTATYEKVQCACPWFPHREIYDVLVIRETKINPNASKREKDMLLSRGNRFPLPCWRWRLKEGVSGQVLFGLAGRFYNGSEPFERRHPQNRKARIEMN